MSPEKGSSPRKRAVNSSDVAQLAGLSRTTVSYVLNGRQDVPIPESTREKVLAAAKRLGYRPNGIARSLVQGRTSTIGAIVPALELSSTADTIGGIEGECSRRGYGMLLGYSHNDPDVEVRQARLLLEHRVDGIICVVGYRSLTGTGRWVPEAIKEQVACVIVDSNVPGVAVDYVAGDDRSGAFAAVSHLLRLGHRRIAHLSAGPRGTPALERREGYRAALAAASLAVDEQLIVGDSFEPADAATAMTHLLNLPKPPTAVFAADDVMAAAAIEVIRRRGLRVPQDVAVVGFNDSVLAQYLHLTTVRLSGHDRGRLAIERLFARMKNPHLPREGIIVPTQLVVRDSCGAGETPAARHES
jgi:DNA-binding LacI/PurR family transcriptional regulator